MNQSEKRINKCNNMHKTHLYCIKYHRIYNLFTLIKLQKFKTNVLFLGVRRFVPHRETYSSSVRNKLKGYLSFFFL